MYKLIIASTLIISVAVWAVDDAGNYGSAIYYGDPPLSTVNFDVTVLNTFECPYATQILGLDFSVISGDLIFSSAYDGKIFICDPDNGAYVGELSCTYTGNPSNFGVASCSDGIYVSDWTSAYIYFWDGSWNSYSSPGSSFIRGLDYTTGSSDYLWGGYSYAMSPPRGCYRMSPDINVYEFIDFPDIPSQISGLTWFDYGGGEGILCTTYKTYNLYFYTISGTEATLEGTISNPVRASSYYGLAYNDTRDTVFLSYWDVFTPYISELQIDPNNSIKSASLGEIKASFK